MSDKIDPRKSGFEARWIALDSANVKDPFHFFTLIDTNSDVVWGVRQLHAVPILVRIAAHRIGAKD